MVVSFVCVLAARALGLEGGGRVPRISGGSEK